MELTIADIRRICEKPASELTFEDMQDIDSYFDIYTNQERYEEVLASGVEFSFHVTFYQDPSQLKDFCIPPGKNCVVSSSFTTVIVFTIVHCL